ncbi:MAG: hypothetical protein IIA83_11100 [Thaumarchaeota archaeon]|nr:hypothetical protein [Nitrososphaerota archaeon]
MVRTREDRRGIRVKGGKQKDDSYYRIRIVMYLLAFREANISDIARSSSYGISSINKVSLKILLEKMILEKWIKKSKYKIYSLDKKGQEMTNFLVNLKNNDENHSLFDVESFIGIKSLG